MALRPEEERRRLVAARELRGLTQAQLGELFLRDGLGRHDPARIERDKMDMQAVHRHAAARHLGLPAAWFTEPDLSRLICDEPKDALLERVEALLGRHDADIRHITLEQVLTQLQELARDQAATRALLAELQDQLSGDGIEQHVATGPAQPGTSRSGTG